VQLAVAFVVGGAFQAIVTSFVSDILMPPIGLIFGNNMQNLFFVIKQGRNATEKYATLAEAANDQAVTEVGAKFKFLKVSQSWKCLLSIIELCCIAECWKALPSRNQFSCGLLLHVHCHFNLHQIDGSTGDTCF
jgi:hypothetical protein